MQQVSYFFIIGAQRSGTTRLYHLLDKHPQISMAKPMRPEPKFFLQTPENIDAENYLNRYHQVRDGSIKAYGEKSTSYYEKPEVATHIKQYFPNAQIIMLLRNPIDRAISNYFFTLQHGLETRTLEEVFVQKTPNPPILKHISVSPFDYLRRGHYSKYLPAYIEKFGRDKVKILIFDNFTKNPQKNLNDVFNYLKIRQEKIEIPVLSEGQNASKKEQIISQEVIDVLGVYYSNEIKQLEELIKIDLSIWKSKKTK